MNDKPSLEILLGIPVLIVLGGLALVTGQFLVFMVLAGLILLGVMVLRYVVFPLISSGNTGSCLVSGILGIISIMACVIFGPSLYTLALFQDNPNINPSGQLIERTEYYAMDAQGKPMLWYYVVRVSDDIVNLPEHAMQAWVNEDWRSFKFAAPKSIDRLTPIENRCYATNENELTSPGMVAKLNTFYPDPTYAGYLCARVVEAEVPYKHWEKDPNVIQVISVGYEGDNIVFSFQYGERR